MGAGWRLVLFVAQKRIDDTALGIAYQCWPRWVDKTAPNHAACDVEKFTDTTGVDAGNQAKQRRRRIVDGTIKDQEVTDVKARRR